MMIASTFHDGQIAVSPRERVALTRLALHLETSYRLRHRPELVQAVLSQDGRVIHREPSVLADGALGPDLIATRDRLHDGGSSGVAAWPALLDGRWSLIPERTGKQRRYLLVENAAPSRELRALSDEEAETVVQAARGLSTKQIAYALGVSSSAVSSRLERAAGKVGAASRTELVRIAALLTRDPRAGFPEDAALTVAEKELLELLERGLSNAQIAATRLRSVRTIANQVASILRKTGNDSRRALITKS